MEATLERGHLGALAAAQPARRDAVLAAGTQGGQRPPDHETPVWVAGAGFAAGATPTAWLSECTAPAGVTPPATPFALPAIAGATATQVTVTINAGTMAAGVACVLRIVNGAPADPSDPCPKGGPCLPFADFSAIASVNGSGNLGTWTQSTGTSTDVRPLPSARTRLGVVSGRANAQTRFIYAYGGDDGAVANAQREVVSTQLSPLGDMLGWAPQRNSGQW